MKIEIHQTDGKQIAEVISEDPVITTLQDGLNLMGDLYFQGFDFMILHEKNLTPLFFDLKTGLAGEILQKFSNYRMGLALIGNFDAYQSKSLRDFILESNKQGQVVFAASVPEAIHRLLGRR